MKIFLLTFLITLTVGCPNSDYVPPRPPPPVTDTEYCDAAEANLKSLGCIPNTDLYTKKLTFTEFCIQKQNDGVFLNPKCLALEVTVATGCSYVDVCTGTANK